MRGKSKKKIFDEQDLKQALIKKALGYDAKEVVEEYAQTKEGEVRLTKRKVTTKSVPPDVSALKILIEGEGLKPVSQMTDEELEREKQRLLKLLEESQLNDKEN